MLDVDDSLLRGSFFGEFMNDFNLLTKKVAWSKKKTINIIWDVIAIPYNCPIELPIELPSKLPTELPIPTRIPTTQHSQI
jgi:hypothetical protein